MYWRLEELSKKFKIPQEVVELFVVAEENSAEPGGWEGPVIQAIEFCRESGMDELASELVSLV